MKLIDTVARDKKEVDVICTKIKALVKKASKYYGRDFDLSNTGRQYTIVVDNDDKLASDMEEIVRKSPNAQMIQKFEHKGDYDWAADTYIRPSSSVVFKMT